MDRSTLFNISASITPIQKRMTALVSKESVQITGNRITMVGNDCIKRPYNADSLKETLTASVWHNRAILFKSILTMGLGFFVFPKGQPPGKGDPYEEDELEEKYPFLFQANEDESFLEISTEMSMDSETIGDGWWEVETDGRGLPLRLYHIPGETMWIEKEKNTTRIPGFVQRANGSISRFHRFGDEKNAEGRPGMIIRFKNPMIGDPFYGVPDYIPAIRAIMLAMSAHDYNYAFFQNGGIPMWLMLVSGGYLSKKAKADLTTFMGNFSFPDNAHKLLAIETDSKEVNFDLKRISAPIEEMSFFKLGEATKDEILAANGVSARLLGVSQPGKLGSGSDIIADLTVLKETVIRPKQKLREFIINTRLLRDGDKIKFNEIDIALPEPVPLDDTEQAMEEPLDKAKSIMTGLHQITKMVNENGNMKDLEAILSGG